MTSRWARCWVNRRLAAQFRRGPRPGDWGGHDEFSGFNAGDVKHQPKRRPVRRNPKVAAHARASRQHGTVARRELPAAGESPRGCLPEVGVREQEAAWWNREDRIMRVLSFRLSNSRETGSQLSDILIFVIEGSKTTEEDYCLVALFSDPQLFVCLFVCLLVGLFVWNMTNAFPLASNTSVASGLCQNQQIQKSGLGHFWQIFFLWRVPPL